MKTLFLWMKSHTFGTNYRTDPAVLTKTGV
jgi:hypothetical protein